MSELKMVNIQKQIRENQTDLSDFLKDLNSWTSEIKEKDETLKRGEPKQEEKLPPVRNSLLKKKKKKRPESKNEPKESVVNIKKKISGYDFRAWDKLDVDKLCEEIDEEDEKKKSLKADSSECETDEEWEDERRKQQANLEKDKGNQLLKENDLSGAIECYTRGIALDPCNALLPANRALALLKQEKFASAEEDCLTALTLDPLYIKAHLRLGASRKGQKKLVEAKEVYEKVLLLEPQNRQAKAEIQSIEKELVQTKMVSQTDPDAGVVKPISKPIHQCSQKPLKRIFIEEIGIEDDFKRQTTVQKITEKQSIAKKNITEKDNMMFERFVQSEKRPKETEQFKNKQVLEQTLEAKMSEEKRSVSLEQQGKYSPRSYDIPQTSFQFQAEYKNLSSDSDAFYEYLKNIEPSRYPRLFGEFLDSNILFNMLKVFNEKFIKNGDDVFEYLKYLSQVKRFSMSVMFFSNKEQLVIKELLAHIQNQKRHPQADIEKLAKDYQVRF